MMSLLSSRLPPVPPSQLVTLRARPAGQAFGSSLNLAYHGPDLCPLPLASAPLTGTQPVCAWFKQPIRTPMPLEATQTLVELSQQIASLIPGAGELTGGLEVASLVLMPFHMHEHWLANERHVDGKLVADACEWAVTVLASVLSLVGQPFGQQFKVVGFVIKVGRGLVSFALDPVQAEARQPMLLGATIARGP